MVRLVFVPQAWINDYGVVVDPGGEIDWNVPLRELLKQFPTREAWEGQHEERDNLRYHANAPSWVREWSGPFEVECEDPFIDPWDKEGTVSCKFCHEQVAAVTAHWHDGDWVGDACCWDERLRSSE